MKLIINLLYLALCGIPLGIFAWDFFSIRDIEIIFSYNVLKILFFTLKQSLLSTVLSFALAIIPAYYIAYKKNFISRLLKGLVFVPFFFPVISVITVFSIIFTSPWLKEFKILYSLKAILIANIFYNSPIFVKYIGEGIPKISKEIIEAMKLDGAGKWTIFFRGKAPILSAQIFKAFLLVFTYTFTSFGIVMALGGIKFSIIEVEIASILRNSLNFSKAFSLGLLQLFILTLINLGGFFIEEHELSGGGYEEKITLGEKIYTLGYILIYYAILGISLIFSFYNYFIGRFSLEAFFSLFSKSFNEEYPVLEGIFNTMILSGITAFFVIGIAYIMLKSYSRITVIIIFSNMGISGAFLATALYYMNVLFDVKLPILLGIGYIFIAIPLAYSFMYQYIKNFPVEIVEASKVDGCNFVERVIYMELPILKNIFISSFFQIFAIIFGEFTIAYTMQIESDFPLVSLVNYSLVSNKKLLEGGALSALNLMLIILFFYVGEKFKREDK